jgi:hypothetical protein
MDRVSDATRREVWGMLCDLERSCRYYGALGDRYRLRYRGVRYFLFLLVLGECLVISLSLVRPLEALAVGSVLALVLGFLTVLDSVTSYGEVSAELRVASAVCGDLGSFCSRLWLDVETSRISEYDARRRLEEIDAQWTCACQRVTLELHPRDNAEAAVSAYRVVSDRYGGVGRLT